MLRCMKPPLTAAADTLMAENISGLDNGTAAVVPWTAVTAETVTATAIAIVAAMANAAAAEFAIAATSAAVTDGVAGVDIRSQLLAFNTFAMRQTILDSRAGPG